MTKHTRRIITFAAAGLVLSLAIPAGAQDPTLRARIPFEFTIGTATLPAGVYVVVEPSTNLLLIRNERHGAYVLGQSADSRDNAENPVLVFHRFGDQYFLRQIRFSSAGVDLPETFQERQTAARYAEMRPRDVKTIVVAAYR
jgi:hypothetical protein